MRHFSLSRAILSLLMAVYLAALVACSSAPSKPGATAGKNLSKVDQALFQQGSEKLKNSAYKKAEKDFKILLTRRPDLAEIWINYGLSLYHQKKFDQLASAIKDMEKRGFASPPRYNLQGLLAVERGQFEDAVKAYERAIKADSAYAFAWYNLAMVYDVYLQQVPRAVEYYQAYMKLVPDDEETKNWVEHLQYSMGEAQ